MEQLLLYLVAFFRPILFIEVGAANLFDIGGVAVIAVLGVSVFIRAATGKTLQLSAIDALIVAFVLWCFSVAAIYPATFDGRGLLKLVAPFIGYTVAKNVILERSQYQRMLGIMIIGFVAPVAASVVLIVLGKGIDPFGENYWTGIVRWAGAYDSSHDMGHNMTFLLMVLAMYFGMRFHQRSEGNPEIRKPIIIGALVLASGALYCLWMSQVRTALVGLFVFAVVYLIYVNWRLLAVLSGTAVAVVTVFFPILKPILLPDLVMVEKTGAGAEALASGRPTFWTHNLELFGNLPLDRQLAGVGIGFNRLPGFLDSHNDLLDVLIQTGVVGFLLFAALQVIVFLRLGQLPKSERYLFRALFVAVLAMNLGSNSYVARFGLAQMYYLVMARIETRKSSVQVATYGLNGVATETRESSGARFGPQVTTFPVSRNGFRKSTFL